MDLINPFQALEAFNIHFDFQGWALWIVLCVFLFVYVIISGILFYHWRKYGMKNHMIVLAEFVFVLVSVFLIYLAIMGILIS